MQLFQSVAAENDVGGVGQRLRPFHRDVELLAHRAGAAVAADQIAGLYRFQLAGLQVPDRGGHAIVMFGEIDQLGFIAQAGQSGTLGKATQYRIEEILRAALALLRALRRAFFGGYRGKRFAPEFVAVQSGHPGAVLRIVAVIAGTLDPGHDAPAPAIFHGADADHIHFRLADHAVGLFNQNARNAAPAKVAGQRQADRSGASDKNGFSTVCHDGLQ